MRDREFGELGQSLVRSLPGFVTQGPFLIVPPVDDLVRGVYLERSQDKDAFYVRRLIMPTFKPTSHVYFSFGSDRVRGTKGRWRKSDPNTSLDLLQAIREGVLPFIGKVRNLSDFIDLVRRERALDYPFSSQAEAYTLTRLQRNGEAIPILEALVRDQKSGSQKYQRDLADEAERLLAKILTNPAAATEQLDEWAAFTIHSLKLDEFRSSNLKP